MSNHLDQLVNEAITENSVAVLDSETHITQDRKLQEANTKLVNALTVMTIEHNRIKALAIEMSEITKRIIEKLMAEYDNGQTSWNRLDELSKLIKQDPPTSST